jgi:hypothetical protein
MDEDGSHHSRSRSPSHLARSRSRSASYSSRGRSRTPEHSVAEEEEAYAMSQGREPRAPQAPVDELQFNNKESKRHSAYFGSRKWRGLLGRKSRSESRR